jgi:hypothetical protein
VITRCEKPHLLLSSGLKGEKAQRLMARMKTDENGFRAKAMAGLLILSVFIRAELGFTRDSAFVLFKLTSGAFGDGV